MVVGVSKIVNNCVTSFMDDLLVLKLKFYLTSDIFWRNPRLL
jgi:hypothetical protein